MGSIAFLLLLLALASGCRLFEKKETPLSTPVEVAPPRATVVPEEIPVTPTPPVEPPRSHPRYKDGDEGDDPEYAELRARVETAEARVAALEAKRAKFHEGSDHRMRGIRRRREAVAALRAEYEGATFWKEGP